MKSKAYRRGERNKNDDKELLPILASKDIYAAKNDKRNNNNNTHKNYFLSVLPMAKPANSLAARLEFSKRVSVRERAFCCCCCSARRTSISMSIQRIFDLYSTIAWFFFRRTCLYATIKSKMIFRCCLCY